MSIERRSCTGSAPHVTKRLCATLMFFIGIACIFGGYMLGRMARNEVKRGNDIVSINLTVAADNLYRKAKSMTPKAVRRNDPERITIKILDAFNCTSQDCGTVTNYDVAEFVKTSIKFEVAKLIRYINNATLFLDSIR